jgi:hypothetical protein
MCSFIALVSAYDVLCWIASSAAFTLVSFASDVKWVVGVVSLRGFCACSAVVCPSWCARISDVFLQGEVARYPIAFDVSDCLDKNSGVALTSMFRMRLPLIPAVCCWCEVRNRDVGRQTWKEERREETPGAYLDQQANLAAGSSLTCPSSSCSIEEHLDINSLRRCFALSRTNSASASLPLLPVQQTFLFLFVSLVGMSASYLLMLI